MLSLYSFPCLIALANFASAVNSSPKDATPHGLAIFYPITPSDDQTAKFSTGNFGDSKGNAYYECRPDPHYPFSEPSFSCTDPSVSPATPESILNHPLSPPDCISPGIVFEHLQWATWTHSCWVHVNTGTDTPEGHAEAAFQSTAVAFRHLVLYQHDKHVFTVNKLIQELRISTDTELGVMETQHKKLVNDVEVKRDADIRALPKHGEHHNSMAKRIRREAEKESAILDADADRAAAAREAQFWKDSFQHRMKIVELDHLVGPYFERWMSGRTQGGWEWAGMGEPTPAWPPAFIVPL